MKLNHFHYFPNTLSGSSAELTIPGLGNVTINNCISDELKKRIEEECITALRIKMGQVVNTEPENVVEAIR